MEISDFAHYSVLISAYAYYAVLLHWLRSLRCLSSLLLKWNIWLRSLRCFTPLLLKRYIWLRSLHYFTFTIIKKKSLTTFSTLFYFTTFNPRDRTTLTTLFLSLINLKVFPQEFQYFHIICMCDSNFTVRKFSGILHALLPKFNLGEWVKL